MLKSEDNGARRVSLSGQNRRVGYRRDNGCAATKCEPCAYAQRSAGTARSRELVEEDDRSKQVAPNTISKSNDVNGDPTTTKNQISCQHEVVSVEEQSHINTEREIENACGVCCTDAWIIAHPDTWIKACDSIECQHPLKSEVVKGSRTTMELSADSSSLLSDEATLKRDDMVREHRTHDEERIRCPICGWIMSSLEMNQRLYLMMIDHIIRHRTYSEYELRSTTVYVDACVQILHNTRGSSFTYQEYELTKPAVDEHGIEDIRRVQCVLCRKQIDKSIILLHLEAMHNVHTIVTRRWASSVPFCPEGRLNVYECLWEDYNRKHCDRLKRVDTISDCKPNQHDGVKVDHHMDTASSRISIKYES